MQRSYLIAGAMLCALLGAVGGFIAGAENVRARAAAQAAENQLLVQQNSDLEHDLRVVRELAAKLGKDLFSLQADSQQTIGALRSQLNEERSRASAVAADFQKAKAANAAQLKAVGEKTLVGGKASVDGYVFSDCVLKPTSDGCLLQGSVTNEIGRDVDSAYFDVTVFDHGGVVLDVALLAIYNIDSGETKEFSEEWYSDEGRNLTAAATFKIALRIASQ